MILALIIMPAVAGAAALILRSPALCRGLLITAAVLHLGLVAACHWARPVADPAGWLALDALGLLFLSISSVLFLFASIYRVGSTRQDVQRRDFEEGFFFTSTPESIFCGCMLFFLSTMTLVCASQQSGLLWIAIEATTLASAPLIYFHRHRRSLEAAWKYLLICSVGIALALLGNFFLAVAVSGAGGDAPLVLGSLLYKARAGVIDPLWLKAAFLLFLVGYGTKMGLAPMHTWLPDAHSESPSSVSALLSGALLNCSFLGILRAHQVLSAAGEAEFGGGLLVGFGLLSMAVAGVFILGQRDYKRMLAYSSVEHMGILSVGVGLGGAAIFGAMFHSIGHSFAKAMLFLTAGNILTAYRTKNASEVRGLVRMLPATGVLWVLGFLAITGMPPFSTFLSEFTILMGALGQGRWIVAAAYLLFIAVVFIGMMQTMMGMAQGEGSACRVGAGRREALLSVLPPAALIAVVFALGLAIPGGLERLLVEAAQALGGG